MVEFCTCVWYCCHSAWCELWGKGNPCTGGSGASALGRRLTTNSNGNIPTVRSASIDRSAVLALMSTSCMWAFWRRCLN
eukprot:5130079-Amphidinium_carterae.1